MIDKKHRFQGYGSLRFVYQKGEVLRGPYCALKYIVNRRRSTYRVAVVVSRKVHKSAVVRNRIRRRMYEAFRNEGRFIKDAYDLVFIVYSDQLATIPAEQIHHAVYEKLEKAGVLTGQAREKSDQRAIVEAKESKA
jgi:ribonuclease P protein component